MAGLRFHATLFQSCLKRGEAVHLPDAQKHPLVGATFGRDGIGSLIIVPIFHHREVAGGMEVLFKEKRSISAEDLVDLELFAGVVSEGLNGAARIVLTRPEQPEYPLEIQALTNIGPHLEPSLREKTGLGDAPPRPSQDTTDAETLLVKSAAADDGACLTHL
jgi:signal transduction protein with GAF and PtsI domain